MAQSSVLPSMRGILSGGNWKILKVTSGRSSPNCAGRNSKPRKAQRNHRLDINLLHFNRTVSPASHAPLRLPPRPYAERRAGTPQPLSQETKLCALSQVLTEHGVIARL